MPTKIAKQKPQKVTLSDKFLDYIEKVNTTINHVYAAKLIQRQYLLEQFRQFHIDFIVNRSIFPANDYKYLWIVYQCWNYLIVSCGHVIHLDDFAKFKVLFDKYMNNKTEETYKEMKTCLVKNIRHIYSNYWKIIPSYIKDEISKAKRDEKEKKRNEVKSVDYFLKKIKKEKKTEEHDDFYTNNTANDRTEDSSRASVSTVSSDVIFADMNEVDDDSSDDARIPDSLADNLIDIDIYDDDDVIENGHIDDDDDDDDIIFDDVDEKISNYKER